MRWGRTSTSSAHDVESSKPMMIMGHDPSPGGGGNAAQWRDVTACFYDIILHYLINLINMFSRLVLYYNIM